MKSFMRLGSALLVCFFVTACGGGGSGSGPAADSVGESKDHYLVSNVDGETIAITVHEPVSLAPGQTYPLVLQGHGFGGSRSNAASRPGPSSTTVMGRLIHEGFGVISIDQRGHGESGGEVRILDPQFEGQDLLQILDWAELNLDWLAYRDDNLLLGATGSSYGGAFQHTILANDPKGRLDAMAPEHSWHDLGYSLYAGQVFKSFWAGALLFQTGSTQSRIHQDVIDGFAPGFAQNHLEDDFLAYLRSVSMVSYCELGLVPKVDALYWPSTWDTLFSANEMLTSAQCVAAQGGDVRVLTKVQSHDTLVGGADGAQCGGIDKVQSIVDWYREKLLGVDNAAADLPKFCWQLSTDPADAVVTDTLPVADLMVQISPQSLVVSEGSAERVSVPLATVGPGGAVLAGVPTINLTISDPAGLEAGDPILFVSLAKRAAGTTSDVELQANQVRPYRGYLTAADDVLNAAAGRFAQGDEVRLLLHASHPLRYQKSGSVPAASIMVEATIGLPLLPGNLPAPLSNQ